MKIIIDRLEGDYALCEWTSNWNHIAYNFHKEDSKDLFVSSIKRIYEENLR